MVTISELRENAETLEPSIKELKQSMDQFLYRNTNAKMINVRVWFDGSLRIHSTDRIPHTVLEMFLKEYGLYHKAHFIKDEGQSISIYELKHWDKR